jgi:hypothetical protein
MYVTMLFLNKIYKINFYLFILLIFSVLLGSLGCSSLGLGSKEDNPEPITLPDNPIEKAAVQGLQTSYKDSTMWQIQKVNVLNITPMAPSGVLVELQDPKELYCVCLEYEARYKVTWTTTEGSPWERTVRNILVMKTQGDLFLPLRPMNICQPFCE